MVSRLVALLALLTLSLLILGRCVEVCSKVTNAGDACG